MAQDSANRRAENGSEYTNVVRALLLGSGLLFLAAALLYDPQLVTLGRGAAPSAHLRTAATAPARPGIPR